MKCLKSKQTIECLENKIKKTLDRSVFFIYNYFCCTDGTDKLISFAPLAQLVEQLTLNQWAYGSSP